MREVEVRRMQVEKSPHLRLVQSAPSNRFERHPIGILQQEVLCEARSLRQRPLQIRHMITLSPMYAKRRIQQPLFRCMHGLALDMRVAA